MMKQEIKILAVDDNKLNQMLIRLFLQKNQVAVDEANNGEEAIAKLKEFPGYDLILMDIQMPVMDGLQATEHIRNVMNCDIPIIAITANAVKEEMEHYVKMGMNDCLSKPFDEQVLMDKIKQQINK